MSNEPIFIGSPTDIATGELALKRLGETNDSAYETEDGVTTVSLERWHKAQEYERATWIDQNQGSIDDRSNDHRIGFSDYAALPKHLGNVIEFGCGAFTQVRNILKDHTADSIVLVDPLAKVYQEKHQHCSYKNDMLDGKPVTVHAVAVEDFDGNFSYDTVIFINVLSHCYDARKVLDVIWRSLKPGGVLVFQERIEERGADLRYDVGHPLTVRQNVLDGFLARFESIVETAVGYWIARKPQGAGRNPEPELVTITTGVASEPVTIVIHQDTWDKLTEIQPLPVEPAAIEPTIDDFAFDQESGDDGEAHKVEIVAWNDLSEDDKHALNQAAVFGIVIGSGIERLQKLGFLGDGGITDLGRQVWTQRGIDFTKPAAIEPTADVVPEQESGDDTAVSNVEPPKKRGRKKKAE